jgi:drug/metabolite transporter (DMT)-like permease
MTSQLAPLNVLRGAAFIAVAVLVFACMDAMTKHLATAYNVPLVVAMRYFGNLVLLVAIFGPREGRGLVTTRRTGLVLLRAASLSAASLFVGIALQRMPVAETIAIIFLAPFGVMLLAGRVLGEKVGLFGWIAATAGFVGVLLIVRPGSGLDPWGVASAFLGAVASVVYNTLSRVLAKTERTAALMFWTTLTGAIVFGVTLPWSWQGVAPSLFDMVMFAAIGVFALVGHFLFTAAYRHAPASVLAPVTYLHLAWAGLLGWLVFDHLPDPIAMVGMGLIAAAGVTAALHAHLTARRALPIVDAA